MSKKQNKEYVFEVVYARVREKIALYNCLNNKEIKIDDYDDFWSDSSEYGIDYCLISSCPKLEDHFDRMSLGPYSSNFNRSLNKVTDMISNAIIFSKKPIVQQLFHTLGTEQIVISCICYSDYFQCINNKGKGFSDKELLTMLDGEETNVDGLSIRFASDVGDYTSETAVVVSKVCKGNKNVFGNIVIMKETE